MPKYDYYPATNQELISDLKLIKHPEGGLFAIWNSQAQKF
jgi:predicted cupin superfamily sugar epimerase